jgi:hypothetical protein
MDDEIRRRWRESAERSRERRTSRRARVAPARRRIARAGFAVGALLVLGAAIRLGAPGDAAPPQAVAAGDRTPSIPVLAEVGLKPRPASGERRARPREPQVVPGSDAIRAASDFANGRSGLVSFALIDSEGRLRGRDIDRQYSSASVVKAMVLAAELRRLAAEGADVDGTTASLLKAMITYSDNEAADAMYYRVGDAGLHEVAKRAGMTGFTIAGYWGNAQITAADMARFFGDLDRMLPQRHREFGQSLLGSVIESQSWGMPAAAGERWAARFKGGWLPDHALVHQAAELREVGGPREIAVAILTDEQPSHAYGIETVEGVAARLLEPSPARDRARR